MLFTLLYYKLETKHDPYNNRHPSLPTPMPLLSIPSIGCSAPKIIDVLQVGFMRWLLSLLSIWMPTVGMEADCLCLRGNKARTSTETASLFADWWVSLLVYVFFFCDIYLLVGDRGSSYYSAVYVRIMLWQRSALAILALGFCMMRLHKVVNVVEFGAVVCLYVVGNCFNTAANLGGFHDYLPGVIGGAVLHSVGFLLYMHFLYCFAAKVYKYMVTLGWNVRRVHIDVFSGIMVNLTSIYVLVLTYSANARIKSVRCTDLDVETVVFLLLIHAILVSSLSFAPLYMATQERWRVKDYILGRVKRAINDSS